MAQTTTAGCIAALDAINALIGASGELRCYSGTIPANADAAITGTLLSTHTLQNPAFGGAVDSGGNALATATSSIGDDLTVIAGTPTHYRILAGGTTTVWQGTVSITAGAGELKFDSVTWVDDGTATITGFTIQMTRT